jgi:two-component system copper resistance phosphate regulon response regulator CusR
MKIFMIEDDAKTAAAVCAGLEAEGYEVVVARTGDEGFSRLRSETADLVILDWMLPGRDGIEILKELRRDGNKSAVLLLTARDAVEDRVLGLDSGADDYLVKPFAFAELLARLRVLLRRSGQEEAVRHQVADLSLDLRTRQVRRGAEEVALTPREFDVLLYLMRAEGQVVTRAMLAREVWRETNRSTPLDNVIDVHLARLRRKIDEGRIVKLIHTVRGVGFLCWEKPRPTSDKAGE